MGWFLREESGSSWKRGWTEQTLSSLSVPPSPLLAVVGIVVVLMTISSYANYRSQLQQTMMGFRLLLLILVLTCVYVAHSVTRYGAVLVVSPRTKHYHTTVSSEDGGGSPWGVALLLVLIVVLVSNQSYIHSKWWPPIWGSNH